MDLVELELDVRPPAASAAATGREAACDRRWRELVAQVGGEVVAPLAAALERLTAAAGTGRLDRAGLQALRDDVDRARRVGLAAQQIGRLGSGRFRLQPQRVHLAQAVRDVLAQRSRERAWPGIGLEQDLRPAEVMIDASILPTLLHAILDWCLEHARTQLEFAVAVDAAPAYARLQCRFAHRPADAAAARAAAGLPNGSAALDSTAWRLVECLAQALALPLQRDLHDGRVQLTVGFAHTVGDALRLPAAPGADPAPPARPKAQPIAGRHVLVVAARRETRGAVRTALHTAGLMLDFVTSVSEARAFCAHGLPDAIVYEAALAGEHFRRLCAIWSAAAPQLAFVEVGEAGDARQVGDPGQRGTARGAAADALGQALVHGLLAAA